MNPELFNQIALWIGYAALLLFVLCVLAFGYLCLYEMVKEIGQRVFLPVWVWHVITTISIVRLSKAEKPEAYVRYLFEMLKDKERESPELKGLLEQYSERVISSSL